MGCFSLVAQLVEHSAVNRKVAGSRPVERVWFYGLMVMTADFESASLGSIPSRTYIGEDCVNINVLLSNNVNLLIFFISCELIILDCWSLFIYICDAGILSKLNALNR